MRKPFDIREKARHFARWRRRRSALRRIMGKARGERTARTGAVPDSPYIDEPAFLVRFRENEYPLKDDCDAETVLLPAASRGSGCADSHVKD